MITLVIGMKSVVCVDSGTFILTVGVKEGPGHGAGVTSYGATARNDSPVNYDDISVFYRRVGKNTCAYQQVNCVVIIILIIPNPSKCSKFYTNITIVIFINFMQQCLQIILSFILATDVGFCFPGLAYTRWFIHQDFYTKVNENIVSCEFDILICRWLSQ